MKAAFLEKIDTPLIVKEVETPSLKKGEALVRLHAAALNHRDVWIQQGKYPKIQLPCVLGSDGAGIVEAVYDKEAQHWIGKEVVIQPGLFWGNNPKVQSQRYEILGMPRWGTFAQYVVVPVSQLYEKPKHLTMEEAAALPLAGLTAYRAVFSRGALKEGERVFINGVGGGVALFAFQFALQKTTEVYVSSGSEAKRKKALSMGAKKAIDYKDKAQFSALAKETKGIDLIIDSAGGETFNYLIQLAAPAARIVFYGITTGPWKNVQAAYAFWKQLSILGSTMGSPQEFQAMLNFVEQHKIKPIIAKTFPLDAIQDAMQYMAQAKQFGKIVITIP